MPLLCKCKQLVYSLETIPNPLGLDEILACADKPLSCAAWKQFLILGLCRQGFILPGYDEMLACADKALWNALAMQMLTAG